MVFENLLRSKMVLIQGRKSSLALILCVRTSNGLMMQLNPRHLGIKEVVMLMLVIINLLIVLGHRLLVSINSYPHYPFCFSILESSQFSSSRRKKIMGFQISTCLSRSSQFTSVLLPLSICLSRSLSLGLLWVFFHLHLRHKLS